MAQQAMFLGQVNSPELKLQSAITTTVQTTIILEGSFSTKLPQAPNLFTIGDLEDAETIYYPTNPTGSDAAWTFVNCVRGYDNNGTIGVAKTWAAGSTVYRQYSSLDQKRIKENIEDLASQATINSKRSLSLTPYNAIFPETNYPDVTQTALTNGFPLPKAAYSKAGAGTEHLYWIAFIDTDWTGGNISAQIEFQVPTISSLIVSFLLYAKRVDAGGVYDVTLPLVATLTKTMNGGSAGTKYLTTVYSFAITGTGNTILLELKRNPAVDTYAGLVNWENCRILYPVIP